MEVQRIEAHPAVAANRGRIALRRGPVVYALEQADNETDLDRVVIPWSAKLTGTYDAKLLGGVGVITGTAMRKRAVNWEDALYRPASPGLEGPVPIRAVPYGVWANRGPGKMAVWVEAR
jgi:DUF1680 family protein